MKNNVIKALERLSKLQEAFWSSTDSKGFLNLNSVDLYEAQDGVNSAKQCLVFRVSGAVLAVTYFAGVPSELGIIVVIIWLIGNSTLSD